MEEVSATLKNAELSAQKVRLVVKEIRGLKVEKAVEVLNFVPKKAAKIVKRYWSLLFQMQKTMRVWILTN